MGNKLDLELGEVHGLMVSENRIFSTVSGLKMEGASWGWENMHHGSFEKLYSYFSFFFVGKWWVSLEMISTHRNAPTYRGQHTDRTRICIYA
jgi:hypothetical protein